MSHNYQLLFASKGNLQIPSVQTTSYGKNAFVYMAIRTWNDNQKEVKGVMLNTFSLVKLKSLFTQFYLNMYKTYKTYFIYIATLSNWLLKIGD